MTIEEIIYCMKSYLPDEQGEYNEHCTNCKYYKSKMTARGCYLCQSSEAHKMAIKSLEAWEFVKAELKNDYIRHPVYDSGIYHALKIIDKYLSEVSE